MAFSFTPESPDPVQPKGSLMQERPMFMGFGISFLLLIAVWLSYTPAKHAMAGFWGRKYAAEALEAMENQDWGLAFHSLYSARKWAPDDEQVLHAMIQVLAGSKADPAGLAQSLERLAERRPLTEAEQIMHAGALISSGKTSDAHQVIAELPESAKKNPEALAVIAELLKAEGSQREAQKVSQQALEANSGSPEARLQLAMKATASPFLEVKQQAHAEVWQIARLTTEAALPAIRQLASEPSLTQAEAQELLTLVEAHPLKSVQDRLTVISALMRLQPEQRDRLVAEEILRFKDRGDAKLEVIALWLAREKQYSRLTQLVPPQLAVKSRELFPIFAQALAEEKRWDELKQLITTENPPIPRAKLSLSLAFVISRAEPGSPEILRYLEASIESAAADKDSQTLIDAASLADKLHLSEMAMNACLAIASFDQEKAVTVLQHAYDEAARLKDARTLLSISRRLHALRPASIVFAHRLAYLRLVIGEEIESVNLADASSRALTPAAADQMPLPLLRSLAAFRLSDQASMLAHLSQLPNPSALAAGPRAVAAGLLSLAGKPGPAFEIAEKIPEGLLLQEESAFLKLAR